MEPLQRTGADLRRQSLSPVVGRRSPAGDEDGSEALEREPPRRSALVVLLFDLSGGSFAFVMATGIVSIAASRLGHGEVGAILFAVNLISFPLLCVLMLVRLFQRPAAILAELRYHRTGAGFLAAVAATSIVGDQFVLLASNSNIAAALWLVSLVPRAPPPPP